MPRFKKVIKFIFWIFIIAVVLVSLVSFWSFRKVPIRDVKAFGVTYSAKFAEKFGMDREEIFLAILEELEVKNVRLPVYWDEVEKADDIYDFKEIDWQLEESQKRGVKVILVVGRKLPRWPECHEPSWIKNQDTITKKHKLLEHLEVVVAHYRNNPALFAWQVENEPFLPFGEDCPLFGGEFLDKEIDLIRRLDPHHPIVVTDSGELSFWVRALKRADIFGTTMYRQVWNENIGFFTYPLPPGFFRVKRALTEFLVGKRPMFVSELQLEPWGPKLLYETPLRDALSRFDVNNFKENIAYAKNSGFDEFYLWGVEWWYYLKINGHQEIWDEAKKLF